MRRAQPERRSTTGSCLSGLLWRHSYPAPQPLVQRGVWIDPHAGLDGHAGAERDIGRGIVHDNLDRYALHDLDPVAGGILSREERERRAGAWLHTGDIAADCAF